MPDINEAFWNLSLDKVLGQLKTRKEGLSSEETKERLSIYGPNLLKPKHKTATYYLLLRQFNNPLILILLFAAALSFFLRDPTDASIILIIVLVSGLLGFWQEKGATRAVEKLLSLVAIKVNVMRDNKEVEIPVEYLVPGDILVFNAGDIIPADCLIIESKDFFIDEATLTGETFAVEKKEGMIEADTPMSKRTNALFMGSHVVSGTAIAVAVYTGKQTEFGKISEHLVLRPPATEFERSIRRFGYFLMQVTFILLICIFGLNLWLQRPLLESFLFALALAVGMTPQLLPAIISVNLSHGAVEMAKAKVIVKRLASIENFGSMNILCADKTGTLTKGIVEVRDGIDAEGKPKEKVILYGYLNSFYQTGYSNPIDQAIKHHNNCDISLFSKLDEIPYDFVRKRLTILVKRDKENIMITKGSVANVLAVCTKAESSSGDIVEIDKLRGALLQKFEELSSQGFRVLGVSYRNIVQKDRIVANDESEMVFLGFLVLYDPPKLEAADTISHLKSCGVSLKIITGDNRFVATYAASQVGLTHPKVITGTDLNKMSDEALLKQVSEANIFAEVEPNQKERIILALRKRGNIVGYLGDGINDASALHAADVGISVESAVDIAKEVADIVLLEKDLSVLLQGIHQGRHTFANTMKYIFMATSANFGNMFSMAGASLLLPFLPLLPKQILLTNLLTDIPEMTISTDNVDKELLQRPLRLNIKFIRKFMLVFGLLSSIFDYATFGILLYYFKSTPIQFRTGWFIESVISASLVVLVIRSRKPFFKSRPSGLLTYSILATGVLTLFFPLTPFAKLFGFTALPFTFYVMIAGIIGVYVLTAECAKTIFYRKIKFYFSTFFPCSYSL